MEAQQPAEGVLIHRDYGDAVEYTVECDCRNDDDAHYVLVEADDFQVSVNIYTTQTTPRWEETFKPRYNIENKFLQKLEYHVKSFLNGLDHRCRVTRHVWTKGFVKYESNIVMTEQQALNYSEILKSAVGKTKEFRLNRGTNSRGV